MLEWLRRLFARPPVPVPVPVPGRPPIASPPLPRAQPAGKVATWLSIALVMVAGFEGLYTKAYKDPVGVTTICYGVTNHDRPVKMGDHYTKSECQDFLAEDLPKYKKQVDRCIKVAMPPHRTAAMVSFVYNVGQGNLCKSSVARYMNQGKVKEACNSLMLWNKAGGRELRGLTNRRAAERVACLRSD